MIIGCLESHFAFFYMLLAQTWNKVMSIRLFGIKLRPFFQNKSEAMSIRVFLDQAVNRVFFVQKNNWTKSKCTCCLDQAVKMCFQKRKKALQICDFGSNCDIFICFNICWSKLEYGCKQRFFLWGSSCEPCSH